MIVRRHCNSKYMHTMFGILITILMMCNLVRDVEIFRIDSDRNYGSTKWELLE